MNRNTALLLCLATTVVACDASSNRGPAASPNDTEPTVTFSTASGDVSVLVEVADTPAERATGLMYRQSLDADRGMIFVFPSEAVQTFWMQNTYIPLDMIFINRGLEVVGVVADAEPLTTTPRTVGVPSMYVVEVNGGFAAAHGIATGTTVTLKDIPTSVPY